MPKQIKLSKMAEEKEEDTLKENGIDTAEVVSLENFKVGIKVMVVSHSKTLEQISKQAHKSFRKMLETKSIKQRWDYFS